MYIACLIGYKIRHITLLKWNLMTKEQCSALINGYQFIKLINKTALQKTT